MLWRASSIKGFEIHGSDGQIGAVTDLLFDDKTWTTKWLTVHTGPWLFGHTVLLQVSILGKPDHDARQVFVRLTRQQVKDSPHAATDLPVSQSIEAGVSRYDEELPFWQSEASSRGLRPEGTTIFMPHIGLDADPLFQAGSAALVPAAPVDATLRSVTDVTGYHIAGTDGAIGHVEDLLFDDGDWRIRYLIVDTKNWLPGLRVVVPPQSIREISWAMRAIYLNVDREKIKSSPLYDSEMTVDGDYSSRVDAHFGLTPVGGAPPC